MTVVVGRRETFWQLVRYGINGGLLTLLYDIVYTVVERFTAATPQIANLVGYLVTVMVGYALHSRVTFRNHGKRDRRTQVRFAFASLLSYALNAFWTWLLTAHFKLHPETPLIPISTITPIVLFAVNRWWVFR